MHSITSTCRDGSSCKYCNSNNSFQQLQAQVPVMGVVSNALYLLLIVLKTKINCINCSEIYWWCVWLIDYKIITRLYQEFIMLGRVSNYTIPCEKWAHKVGCMLLCFLINLTAVDWPWPWPSLFCSMVCIESLWINHQYMSLSLSELSRWPWRLF